VSSDLILKWIWFLITHEPIHKKQARFFLGLSLSIDPFMKISDIDLVCETEIERFNVFVFHHGTYERIAFRKKSR